MPEIIATRRLRYARRTIETGKPFEASPKDCLLLVAAGLARPSAQVSAGSTTAPPPAAKKPKGKRGQRYQNRMLESE